MLRLSSSLLLACLLYAAAVLPVAVVQGQLDFACNTTVVNSSAWDIGTTKTKVAANLLLLFPLSINSSLYGLPAYALTVQFAEGTCGHKCPVIAGRLGLYSPSDSPSGAALYQLNQTTPFEWEAEYQVVAEAAISNSPLLPSSTTVYVGISTNTEYWIYTTQPSPSGASDAYKIAHSGTGTGTLPAKVNVKNLSKYEYTAAFQLAICDT